MARGALALARGVRARADARPPRGSRRPAVELPGDPRRRDEREDLDDADLRRAPPRVGLARRRVRLAACARLGRADPGRRQDADLEQALARVRPHAAGATQFEVLTAAALAEFAAQAVDVAVVEAGLGGRHDATNVLDARVVVLTNVALEHTEVLGTTREEIAAEKLAVISPGAVVIVSASPAGKSRHARTAPPASTSSPARIWLSPWLRPRRSSAGRSTRTQPRRCAFPAGSSAAARSRSRSGTARTTSPASATCSRACRRAASRSSRRSSPTRTPTGCSPRSRRSATRWSRRARATRALCPQSGSRERAKPLRIGHG